MQTFRPDRFASITLTTGTYRRLHSECLTPSR